MRNCAPENLEVPGSTRCAAPERRLQHSEMDMTPVEIEKIFRDRSETIPLKYIYLRAWFESKSENQPLKKVLKKELQRYRLEEREKYQAIS